MKTLIVSSVLAVMVVLGASADVLAFCCAGGCKPSCTCIGTFPCVGPGGQDVTQFTTVRKVPVQRLLETVPTLETRCFATLSNGLRRLS